ncbi:MAG: universal stress protein [Bacteroidota bacterium]
MEARQKKILGTVTRPPEPTELNKIMVAVDPKFGIRELRRLLEQYRRAYTPVVDPVAVALNENDIAKLEHHLDQQRKTLIKQGIKDVTTTVRRGYIVSESLLDYARQTGHDMIWMETHGRKGLAKWIIVRVTEEVLQYSPVPVLSLHPEREPVRKTYYHENLPI